MPHTPLLDRLAAAELALVTFNAHRTSASEAAPIRRTATRHFEVLEDGARPGSAYYNRAVARQAGVFTADALQALPAGVVAVELRPSELTPDTAGTLLRLGFTPAETLCYLAAEAPAAPLPVPLPVRQLGTPEVPLLFDLLERSGVTFPPERRAAKQHHYCTAQFQAFVATAGDGTPMAWATLFLHAGCAFLGNAYTLPAWRGRGAQAALLAARMNAARACGAAQLFTDVEHASQSHRNCERAGFRTATINTLRHRPAGHGQP